jgi:flagellar export protein FliJ
MPPEFSLQSVLDYRHTRVEAMEIGLGRLHLAEQQKQTELHNLRASQGRLFAELRGRQEAGALDLSTIAYLRLNLKTIERNIAEVEKALIELARQIEEQRAALVAAKQGEETLGTLKDKERVRYEAELARREDRQRDDIYIAQGFRRAATS